MQRALVVSLLFCACSDPGSGSGTTTPPSGAPMPPTPTPTPPVSPPAPGALADPARVPFELRVEHGATPPPADQAWIDLLRAGLPDTQHPPADRGYELRARVVDVFGTKVVQLSLHPDANGASGHSFYSTAELLRMGDAWQHVQLNWIEDQPFEIVRCSIAPTPVLQNCEPHRPEIARAMLAMPDPEMAVRQLLGHVRSLHAPHGSFRIALRRNEVPRDVEWNPGRTFVPWVVQRRGDVVTGSGMFLMERDWYRFSLRAEATGLTLEHERIARAPSRGVPP